MAPVTTFLRLSTMKNDVLIRCDVLVQTIVQRDNRSPGKRLERWPRTGSYFSAKYGASHFPWRGTGFPSVGFHGAVHRDVNAVRAI